MQQLVQGLAFAASFMAIVELWTCLLRAKWGVPAVKHSYSLQSLEVIQWASASQCCTIW